MRHAVERSKVVTEEGGACSRNSLLQRRERGYRAWGWEEERVWRKRVY